mgnify:CR=1 FL=1
MINNRWKFKRILSWIMNTENGNQTVKHENSIGQQHMFSHENENGELEKLIST